MIVLFLNSGTGKVDAEQQTVNYGAKSMLLQAKSSSRSQQ